MACTSSQPTISALIIMRNTFINTYKHSASLEMLSFCMRQCEEAIQAGGLSACLLWPPASSQCAIRLPRAPVPPVMSAVPAGAPSCCAELAAATGCCTAGTSLCTAYGIRCRKS